MGQERKTISAAMEPLETTHRSRLAETYVRYAPDGIRLAYLLTGDRALAEDLVHEAFLRFVGRLHFLRDPEAFEGYLRRTIVNLSKNHFRRRAVERSYLAREAGRAPDVRIVFRYYEDLPEARIAEILGCRPATVRSLVSRGLETLRRNPEVMA